MSSTEPPTGSSTGPRTGSAAAAGAVAAGGPAADSGAGFGADPGVEDTLDLPCDVLPRLADAPGPSRTWLTIDDLLDDLPGWGPVSTPQGIFQLVPVRPSRDLELITRWMNDPSVAEFWQLCGPPEITERHLRRQIDGDGRSMPCLGVLDGTPMSYWEIYRADLDPIARYYPARPHDTGVHLLIGRVVDRGRGLGAGLLRAASDHILDHRPACARVIAEPDLQNTPSVAAFLTAGFRFAAELELPDKRAALMVRDRALRPWL